MSETMIRSALERYADAWARQDLPAIAACYHDGFTLHWFGNNPLSGVHAGKAAAMMALGDFSRRTRRGPPVILAVMAGPERGTILARETFGETQVERLLLFAVEDGLLKDCWVYDRDPGLIDTLIGK